MKNPLYSSRCIHPFIFGIFPIVSLYAHNSYQTPVGAILLPLTGALIFAVITCLFMRLIFRNKHEAGIAASLVLLLFYSYGHLYRVLEGVYIKIGTIEIGANKSIILIYTGLFILTGTGALGLRRSARKIGSSWTITGNIVAYTIIGTIVLQLCAAVLSGRHGYKNVHEEMHSSINTETKSAELPNIYYIILDGFGRSDILRDRYDIHDTLLESYLTQMGFHSARFARSNYGQTVLSLASSLNTTYLDTLAHHIGTDCLDRKPAWHMIRNNSVFRYLKQKGYTTIALSSGFWFTKIKTADIYIPFGFFSDDFINGIIAATPIEPLLRKLNTGDLYGFHRRRILWEYKTVESLASRNGPFILFAHILAPHPPFTFNVKGAPAVNHRPFSEWEGDYPVEEYRRLYRDQLLFIAHRTRFMAASILAASKKPPVILIQSDHGPGSGLVHNDPLKTDLNERMGILNALYLPCVARGWNDSVTPVNNFRIIFNNCFNESFPLLENRSCFSTWEYPYRFMNVDSLLDIK